MEQTLLVLYINSIATMEGHLVHPDIYQNLQTEDWHVVHIILVGDDTESDALIVSVGTFFQLLKEKGSDS